MKYQGTSTIDIYVKNDLNQMSDGFILVTKSKKSNKKSKKFKNINIERSSSDDFNLGKAIK